MHPPCVIHEQLRQAGLLRHARGACSIQSSTERLGRPNASVDKVLLLVDGSTCHVGLTRRNVGVVEWWSGGVEEWRTATTSSSGRRMDDCTSAASVLLRDGKCVVTWSAGRSCPPSPSCVGCGLWAPRRGRTQTQRKERPCSGERSLMRPAIAISGCDRSEQQSIAVL